MSVLDRSVVMLVVLASAAAAQAPLSDSVMKLNRAGRWEQAAQLARNSLGSTASTDERCALRINAIYSLTRLGAYTTAASELKTLDSQCGESAVVRQWAKDLAAIRSELALPPLPKSGLDFSALDQFWNIADLLVKDAEPPEDAWRSMLSSVGYRLSTMVVPTTRSDLEIALRPSRQAEFDSLIKGTDDRASRLKHLAGVVKHRAAVARYRDSISRSLPVQEAIALAARFLPPHATEGKDPPLVAFAVFRDDAYSLGPQGVVIDIEHVTNNGGLTLTLAHEFHHSYLADVAEIGRPPSDDPAFALMNALNGMRNEGIADLIDKPYPLSYPKAPGMARYAESYNAAYAKTPTVIHSIDSALAVAADDSTKMAEAGRRVQQLLPSNGHFNGSYVAREIYESFGVDSLYPGVRNPFAFLRTYSAAEKKRGNPPPFSTKATALLDGLERKYLRR